MKRICLMVVSACFAGLMALTGRGADWYVATGGSDSEGTGRQDSPYRTITKALSSASSGDVVHVGEGTYSRSTGESFPLSVNGVSVVGAGRAETIVDGEVDGNYDPQFIFELSGSGSAVKDLTACNSKNQAVRVIGTSAVVENIAVTQVFQWGENVGAVSVESGYDVVVRNCEFTGMVRIVVCWSDGQMTIENCVFSNNISCRGTVYTASGNGSLTVTDSLFQGNQTMSQGSANPVHDAYAASVFYGFGGSTVRFSRCRFIGNEGDDLFGAEYCASIQVENCLFKGNAPARAMCFGYASNIYFYSCTMTEDRLGFWATRQIKAWFANCLYLDTFPMAGKSTVPGTWWQEDTQPDSVIYLARNHFGNNDVATATGKGGYGATIYYCDGGYSAADQLNGEVALDGDGVPKAYSSTLDGADSAFEPGEVDLAGNKRVAANLSDTPVMDFGCFESTYRDALVPTVQFSDRQRLMAMRSSTATATVRILPVPESAAEVALAYPEGITGPASVTLDESNGYAAKIALQVGAAAAQSAVTASWNGQTANLDVFASTLSLTIGGARQFVKADEDGYVSVELAGQGITAPSDITVMVENVDGAATAAWENGAESCTIAAGGRMGDVRLKIGSPAGVSHLRLIGTVPFAESGATALDVTVVAYPGYLCLGPDGNDDTADGTEDHPFGSLSAALSHVRAGDAVRLLAGTYGAATGLQFPIALNGVTLEGVGRDKVVIDCGNAAETAVSITGTATLRNMTVCNTTKEAVRVMDATALVEDVLFTQTREDGNAEGGVTAAGDSHVTVKGCRFQDIRRTGCCYYNAYSNLAETDRFLHVEDCEFVSNASRWGTVFANYANCAIEVTGCLFKGNDVIITYHEDGYSHNPVRELGSACSYGCSGVLVFSSQRAGYWGPTLKISRCRFENNTGKQLFGATCLASPAVVDNSLFIGNNVENAMLYGTDSTFNFRNCTMKDNVRGYWAGYSVNSTFENCLYLDPGPLAGTVGNAWFNPAAGMVTLGRNAFNAVNLAEVLGKNQIGANLVYDESDLMNADPVLDDDLAPKAYSPVVDAGVNASVVGATDLAGKRRIANSTGAAEATVDFGCFEQDYADSDVPMFHVAGRGRRQMASGTAETFEVKVLPPPESRAAVTAKVTLGKGLVSEASEIVLTEENDYTGSLVVTAGAEFAGDSTVRFETASGSAGAAKAFTVDVNVALVQVSLPKARYVARAGTGLLVPVVMNGGLPAPQKVTFKAPSVTAGSSACAWEGDAEIAEGASESTGRIRITVGAGRSTVVVTCNELMFAESSGFTREFEVVGYEGGLAVDPVGGDDETGYGTAEHPYRTVAKALTAVGPGDALYLGAGVYGPTGNGEVFPLAPGGVGLVGIGDSVVFDANNRYDGVLAYADVNGGAVSNVTIRNTKGAPVTLSDSTVVLSGCTFAQNDDNYYSHGGVICSGKSNLTLVDCLFDGLKRMSCVYAQSEHSDLHEASLTLRRCTFSDLSMYRAGVWVVRNSLYDILAEECAFLNCSTPEPQNGDDRSGDTFSPASFFLGNANGMGNYAASTWIDRCRFVGGVANHVIGGEYNQTVPAEVSNCLFADCTSRVSSFMTSYGRLNFRNCTFVNLSSSFAPLISCTALYNCIVSGTPELQRNFVGGPWAADPSVGTLYLYDTLVHNGKVDTEKGTCVTGNLVYGDPVFVRPSDGDYRLGAGSPARNAGQNENVLGTLDLAGNARIIGKKVDLGCHEGRTGFMIFIH